MQLAPDRPNGSAQISDVSRIYGDEMPPPSFLAAQSAPNLGLEDKGASIRTRYNLAPRVVLLCVERTYAQRPCPPVYARDGENSTGSSSTTIDQVPGLWASVISRGSSSRTESHAA